MDRWNQIDKLLGDALEHQPEERADFLRRAGAGDTVLRREVESLLAAHDQAGSFIESSPAETAAEMFAGYSEARSKGLAGDLAESMSDRQIGDYRILSRLGEGGMGAVFLAQDTKLRRKVAIKLLTGAPSGDARSRKRLIREAQAVAKLDHPGICPVFEVGLLEPDSFIVMQYIDGETLAARIHRGLLGVCQSLDFAHQIAAALAEAHSQGVIHRDIKPQNVLINTRGQTKVLDFGLAKIIEHTESPDDRVIGQSLSSTPGLILGTVPYMSPEQLRGEPLDIRTDIFSFGALLYEMLSGTQPFASDSSAETIAAILTRDPPLLSEYGVELPLELQQLVSRCLEKDRSQRYQTMTEVAARLEGLFRKSAPSEGEASLAFLAAQEFGTVKNDRALKGRAILGAGQRLRAPKDV
jgi:serine/threonine protein kinase